MVYVSHHADNRRTFYHCLFVFILFTQKFLNDIDFYFPLTNDLIFNGNFFCRLKADLLIDCDHLPLEEQFFHDHGRLNLHFICQFLDCQRIRQCNGFDLFFLFFFCFFLRFDKPARFVSVLSVAVLVNGIFSGSFITLLIHPAFFIVPVLFSLFCRSLRCKGFRTHRFPEFIVLPASSLFRTIAIVKIPATVCTALKAATILAETVATGTIIRLTASVIMIATCSLLSSAILPVLCPLGSGNVPGSGRSRFLTPYILLGTTAVLLSAVLLLPAILLLCFRRIALLLIHRLDLSYRRCRRRRCQRTNQRPIHAVVRIVVPVMAAAPVSASTVIIVIVMAVTIAGCTRTLRQFAVMWIADKDNVFLFSHRLLLCLVSFYLFCPGRRL